MCQWLKNTVFGSADEPAKHLKHLEFSVSEAKKMSPASTITADAVAKGKNNQSVADGIFQPASIEHALVPPLRLLCCVRRSGRCHVLTLHIPTSPLKGRNGGTMFSWSGCRDPSDDLENLSGLQKGRCATSGSLGSEIAPLIFPSIQDSR